MNKRLRIVCATLLFALLVMGSLGSLLHTTHAEGKKKKRQPEPGFVPGRILVQFKPETMGLGGNKVIEEAGAHDAGEIASTGVHIVDLPAGANEEAFLEAFKSRPEVEFAELDQLLPPEDMVPNDPGYSNEWHLPKIGAPSAWTATTGASNVVIAICDTGVDPAHADLSPKLVAGWNVYDNNSDTRDVYGHGTKVAGTAAACSNNQTGVASVAWGCSIMPVRVSDPTGYALFSNIANGIVWAADHGARVANVSYKATASSTVASAASYMQSKGGVVTVSSGNDGGFDSSADNPYVLTVGATDASDMLYSWSATGNNVDLAAPGYVYTTANGGGYTYTSGTSFSAPIVAGVAALVISQNPGLSGAQVQNAIKQSADDRGVAGWDTSYGWGRVNAARAVGANPVTGDVTAPTVSISSPASGAVVSGAVTVQAAASDDVGVSSVSFSVDGTQQATDTATPYSFTWNTTMATNGAHTLSAAARDAAGNVRSVTVTVTVSNSAADTTPPVVTITSPANGSAVPANVSVYVSASDNVGVVRVDLYVDGSLASTSTAAPFTTKWNARKASAGAHTLVCKAYDAAGNATASSAVTVYR